jgi:hypothetical protein
MTMGLAVWRDVSLLWLTLLTLIAALPFAVLFYFAIRGMVKLRQVTKKYLPLVQEKAELVADTTEGASQKAIAPVIQMRAKGAQVQGIRKAIFVRRQEP